MLATNAEGQLVSRCISILSEKFEPQPTYLSYSSEAYKSFPQFTMMIAGRSITFLVDSGATNSVIKSTEFPSSPKLSGRFVYSMGASGQVVKENLTVPLPCNIPNGDPLKHSFLLSNLCPINLMGRDLMCRLGICLLSTPEGIKVTELSEVFCTMALSSQTDLLYAYQWKVTDPPKGGRLLEIARSLVSSVHVDFMMPDDLHCTSHISIGADTVYETGWFLAVKSESLQIVNLYYMDFCCVAEVLLKQEQSFFDVCDSTSHVSLVKSSDMSWRDLGPFLDECLKVSDWVSTPDPNVSYSLTMNCFKKSFLADVPVVRHVQIVKESVHLPLLTMTQSDLSPDPALDSVPKTLWATGKYDVGLIKNCEPVVITPKSDFRTCRKQYPLKPEALAGIRPVFESLLNAGVIVPCESSPVRSPLFPVKKIRDVGLPVEWRFVQDLQAVNAAVQPRAPHVPNPYTILSQVPPTARFFSVVDLANAFFSVPVHKDSQYWFAFNFDGKAYTFTRLCQGYCESPTIYNEAIKTSLETLELSPGTVLLTYVDDLMTCSPTADQCRKDTITLLKHLASEGHKASLSKLQFVKESVTFLGHVITAESKSLSPKRIAAIQNIPKPITKKQVMSFLGICSYCRQFIQNYAILEAPLSALIHGQSLSSNDKVTWTPEAYDSFCELKLTLQSSPTLDLPDPTRPFIQAVDEKNGCMTSVLLQEHGGGQRPVAYFSAKLDPVAAGLPLCLRAVAAAEKAVMASRDIVGYSPLTLLVPHAVSLILLEQKTSHLSAARWLRYNASLLNMPNITIKRCNVLNPATLLPTIVDGEPHDCVLTLQEACTPRPDLQETPLSNPDFILFVDGSASRDPSTSVNKVGYAVCSAHDTLVSGSLPSHLSAQAAELVALTEACRLAAGKSVTIYTDSRYAFGVVHDFGALWKHRKFLTSSGKPISHHTKVAALLDAILLPSKIAVCKCQAHTHSCDPVSLGNDRADKAAKAAAQASTTSFLFSEQASNSEVPSSLAALQSFATPQEKALWKSSACILTEGVWRSVCGKPCLPKHFFPHFAKLTHGRDHASKAGMISMLTQQWFKKGFTAYAQRFCQSCMICANHNVGRGIPTTQAAHPPPSQPFEHLMMDFIELTPSEGKVYCLVMVDLWSKWIEAFPAKHATSHVVTKALLTEIVPRWGIPAKVSSDNGAHFVNSALDQVGEYLGIDMRRHCAYHPASGGAVEQENGTLKMKLAKCCEDTGLSWTKALPIALTYMRMRKRTRTNLSPFEILFGRPPTLGISTQVKDALPQPAEGTLHNLKPGDWIVVKDLRRKNWRSKRWLGPFQILLTTHTAVNGKDG
ncbi:uncharacterized protein LOC124486931 isoform X2 [Hypomesus transpacificus]|uniref:uncharacterized protein LOC124486931 isoform X2 n=1 Tax=Hypomesus transpacificus TaxID=137520 RepID=UPI001F086458|nr:uncharacterized protein LOC124486931 isoform X2 [Hypomesus transpacificus]